MKITIVPASTKTGAATVRSLLSIVDGTVKVNAVYRDLSKAPAEFGSCDAFFAVKGDVSVASSLDFAGSDVVLAITPPVYDGRDPADHANLVSRNVKDAVERAGSVKRLVLLSSIGAQYDHGVGEIKTNRIAETVLASTNVPEVIIMRCSYFMENWTMSLDTLQAREPFFYSTITPLDWEVPMVAVEDIGLALARELTKNDTPPTSPYVFELHGPKPYTPLDVQKAFSQALGKKVDIKPVEKEALPAFYGSFLPPEIVNDWVEMATSFLPGGIMMEEPDVGGTVDVVHGKTELADALMAATAGIREA